MPYQLVSSKQTAYSVIKLLYHSDKDKAFNLLLVHRAKKQEQLLLGDRATDDKWEDDILMRRIKQKQLGLFTLVTVYQS